MRKAFWVIALFSTSMTGAGWLWLAYSNQEDSRVIAQPEQDELSSKALLPLSYLNPNPSLSPAELANFHAGKALAHQPWVKAPSVTDNRDGLGPLHNAMSCLFCHVNGGRGKLPELQQNPLFATLVRLSLPGFDAQHGVIPEPTYGDQLQQQSTALAHLLKTHIDIPDVLPEAEARIEWQTRLYQYPDGQQIQLRYPKILLNNLAYGAMHPDTQIGLRNAQPLVAMGLVEAIDQSDIDALADPDDINQDGISGRVNQVWDIEQQTTRTGRFGWKANQPSVKQQNAAAFRADVGITNRLFPEENCTSKQILCQQQPSGNHALGYELTDTQLDLVTFFITQTAPLAQATAVQDQLMGKTLFHETGCAACHHPSYDIKQPNAQTKTTQSIFPYSDWLLHDMGEDLSDHRSDFLAQGNEWRTAPLWGVGRSPSVNGSGDLLHDGRARSIEEAILWHGGEGKSSRDRFSQLTESQRQALIQFVESL